MIYATFVEIFVLVSLTRKKKYLVQDTLYQYSGLFFSNSVAKYYHIKMTSN